MTIKRPVITEKTINEYKTLNKVTFEVDLNTNKKAAKVALEKLFNVKVGDITTKSRLGKYKNIRGRRELYKKADKKIMTFTLKTGKIDIFDKGE